MSEEEALDVTRIHSIAGLLGEDASLITTRPFRSSHHNLSPAALAGGGAGLARPGEVSLAHETHSTSEREAARSKTSGDTISAYAALIHVRRGSLLPPALVSCGVDPPREPAGVRVVDLTTLRGRRTIIGHRIRIAQAARLLVLHVIARRAMVSRLQARIREA